MTENDAPFGGGGYYAYDGPTLDRADAHGCLDEDVNTGDPLVCRECAYPARVIPPDMGRDSDRDDTDG